MENEVDLLILTLDQEKDDLLYLGHLASVHILSEVEDLAAVHNFEPRADNIGGVVELELKVVEHELVGLHE